MAHYSDESTREKDRYPNLKSVIADVSQVLVPPERVKVSEAAEKYFRVHNPPAYSGPYLNEKVPYLQEVMDTLESRDYSSVCLVAPAQSGKTNLTLAWLTYSIVCDPSDFLVVEKSQTESRTFSLLKVDRMIRHSPEIYSRLIQRRSADNTHDKKFKSGTYLNIAWPTVNSLSGKTIRRVALSDYDRFPLDIGGEGSAFDLARRRTTTFKRLGMTYVESSPSYDVMDPRWRPATPHQAPPCEGVLAVFNRGDRRRRYWQCPHCREWFEPSFSTLRWPDSDDAMECAEQAFMACPHCFDQDGAIITQSMRSELDHAGVWLRDGEKIDSDGKRYGKARRSDIASFWLKGPNAAFSQWKSLVINWLLANQEYESTGNDRPLKTCVNTDLGEAYVPPHAAEVRAPEDLMERAKPFPEKTVPRGVRFLVATIDTQARRWEVQVHGIKPAPGSLDIVLIDRFAINKSKRKDEDGDRLWVNPGSYLEDWDLITEQVVDRSYPIQERESTENPRQMAIRAVGCDSGGRVGVTTNAYNYYRKLRKSGYAGRFRLIKGEPKPNAPRVEQRFPDSQRKDRAAGARGEIPVLHMNSNVLKDWVDKALGRTEPGGGYIEFPDWLGIEFYRELCVEVKTAKGWENLRKRAQEAWDQLYYCYGMCLWLGVERINWDEPPVWASEWDTNPLVTDNGKSAVAHKPKGEQLRTNLAKLAENLG